MTDLWNKTVNWQPYLERSYKMIQLFYQSNIYPTLIFCLQGIDNISQNTFLEYIMMEGDGLESALVEMLADPVIRSRHGQDVLLLLTLLVNYRKYEVGNWLTDKTVVMSWSTNQS